MIAEGIGGRSVQISSCGKKGVGGGGVKVVVSSCHLQIFTVCHLLEISVKDTICWVGCQMCFRSFFVFYMEF